MLWNDKLVVVDKRVNLCISFFVYRFSLAYNNLVYFSLIIMTIFFAASNEGAVELHEVNNHALVACT